MARYKNGRLPSSKLIWFKALNQYGRWERFRATRATAARLKAFFKDVKANTGVQLYITSGPNVYRDYGQQRRMKIKYTNLGRPWQAATAGTSSHGGEYRGRDSLAADIYNYRDIPWSTFEYYAHKHGLSTDVVSPQELWHVVDFNPYTMPATASSKTSSSKDTKVKTYHKQDATARKSGRDLSPGERFYLHLDTGKPQSNASNVVGNPGQYSITTHVYGKGTPGDIVELVLMWQKPSAKNPGKTNSEHYKERLTVDRDGYIRASREFKRGVSRGWAVYARLTAANNNEDNVEITVFDTDAYLFIGA